MSRKRIGERLRTGRRGLLCLALLGVCSGGCDATAPRGTGAEPEPPVGALALLDEHLAAIDGAARGTRHAIDDADVSATFPDARFFALRFAVHPVVSVPPAPLAHGNLLVVSGGSVTRISRVAELEAFFREHLPAARTSEGATRAARSWLRLVQEFYQDGFYDFEAPTAEGRADQASGRVGVVPERGNKGELTVRLRFAQGRLVELEPGGRTLPGIRPKCQALRLLDPDPVVREIMRRDLLVMGRASRPYLDAVRAGADPALQRAIDEVWEQILREGR